MVGCKQSSHMEKRRIAWRYIEQDDAHKFIWWGGIWFGIGSWWNIRCCVWNVGSFTLDLEWLVSSQQVIKHDVFATQANKIGDIYTHTSTNGNHQYIPIRILFFIFPARFRTLPFPDFPHWMNLDFGLWSMIIFHRVWHSQRFFYSSTLFVNLLFAYFHIECTSHILNSCLHWNYFFIKMLVTYKHRIDLFQQRTSIQYILLNHVKFFIAQKLFYTPLKAIKITIFMQKSSLEIVIWVLFWGCVKQCKSLCVQ